MILEDQPRVALGSWPTPLVRACRLEQRLGCGPLLVKRDDLAGFALAGNKTRPLEFILGAARHGNYQAIVTGGVPASNFAQAAAVAARVHGLSCHLLLPGEPPPTREPMPANLALAATAGAQLTFTGGPREELDERIAQHAAALSRGGQRALAVPRGGASATGSLGFVQAAVELRGQLRELGHEQARIVLAVGSGGSIAGLLVGAAEQARKWAVTGVSVSRPLPQITAQVVALAERCADQAGLPCPPPDTVQLADRSGRLHGALGREERQAIELALQTEGLLLDPDYTAPAFLTALELARQDGPPVVFWHTGGTVNAIRAIGGVVP